MTEAEAKTKQCCGPEGCGTFKPVPLPVAFGWARLCVGQGCMAWRWAQKSKPEGYCGLAGVQE